MAGKGSQTPQPVRKASRSNTPPPVAAQNGLAHTPKSLQRSGSMRVRGEAARTGVQPPLRREKTVDSLRPRRPRPLRSTSVTPSPEVTPRGVCSLPQSPTLSRRSSGADSSWETQSVLNSSSPFSTEGISRNGTTFSSRHNKYLIHCAKRVDDEHYLTPTQRTTRDLKRLRGLLDKAHETIQQKDIEIHRLKQELISLRLRSAPEGSTPDLGGPVSDLSGDLDRLSDPDNTHTLIATSTPDSSSRLTDGEAPSFDTPDAAVLLPVGDATNLSCPTSPRGVDVAVKPLLVPSVGDSGTFDCLTSPSISSKESGGRPAGLELEERFGDDWEASEHWVEWEEKRLREESERRIAELNQQHASEYQEMKEKYNDKVEDLLQKLTEANSRYFEVRPLYDASRLRVGQLELKLEKERSRAEKKADTRDTSAQTTAGPGRTEQRPDSHHISVQTAAGPAQVAAQSQTPPLPPSVAPRGQPTLPSSQKEAPLSAFQQQHQANRPSHTPPEQIQVTALVHSPAQRSQEASETSQEAPETSQEAPETSQVAPETQDGAQPDSALESPDWPPELATPVARQPQVVTPPSSGGSAQMAVPFTRYFAHVAAQVTADPAQAAIPAVDDSAQTAAPVAGDSAEMAAPVTEDWPQAAELAQRLSQTESELERVRSLYCQQLALLEDSQPSSAQPSSLEMDPPMRLQFLKSAVFHYLTDKDDYAGHMRAISAVLQFSDWEMQEVERVRSRKTSHA